MSVKMPIEDWMRVKTKGRTFKERNSSGNNNIVGRLSEPLILESGSKTYIVEGGTEYCIFRKLGVRGHGGSVAASFFLNDGEVLNVLGSGRMKLRPNTSSAKL
jgi:hypothetical protein